MGVLSHFAPFFSHFSPTLEVVPTFAYCFVDDSIFLQFPPSGGESGCLQRGSWGEAGPTQGASNQLRGGSARSRHTQHGRVWGCSGTSSAWSDDYAEALCALYHQSARMTTRAYTKSVGQESSLRPALPALEAHWSHLQT